MRKDKGKIELTLSDDVPLYMVKIVSAKGWKTKRLSMITLTEGSLAMTMAMKDKGEEG